MMMYFSRTAPIRHLTAYRWTGEQELTQAKLIWCSGPEQLRWSETSKAKAINNCVD
jgi:hypothetical protein